ncbi:hypothetical protein RND71_000802 [Anisodus tanguticus]|uniref:Uncharacterized protein n=1 Tax=Anisodus tanguticus TaxID=243964 RepID=A0AAE1VY35_9SOLA|nr:hypothetical protein RND71_000802 [Anisodus tanguticus]
MPNISSGNCSAGAEEEYEYDDQPQNSNVLPSARTTSDGSTVHQEQALPNKKRRKLPGNPGKLNSIRDSIKIYRLRQVKKLDNFNMIKKIRFA